MRLVTIVSLFTMAEILVPAVAAHAGGPSPSVRVAVRTWAEAVEPLGPRLIRTAGSSRQADFSIRAGGICDAAAVRIYANRVPLASRANASPDQDGHLGHYAPGMATPVSSRSWGAIKLLYQ